MPSSASRSFRNRINETLDPLVGGRSGQWGSASGFRETHCSRWLLISWLFHAGDVSTWVGAGALRMQPFSSAPKLSESLAPEHFFIIWCVQARKRIPHFGILCPTSRKGTPVNWRVYMLEWGFFTHDLRSVCLPAVIIYTSIRSWAGKREQGIGVVTRGRQGGLC